MILTFHSCFSSIFNDWYLSIFFQLLVLDVLISWHCDANSEAGLFHIVDQHDFRPIVKQILVSLDEKILEDLGMIIPDYFFWCYPPVFTVLKVVLSTYSPVYYWGHIFGPLRVLALCSRWRYVPRFLHVACTTCIWDLTQCGRSRVPLPWCQEPVLELLWSEPRCSLWCCFYWAIDDMCGLCLPLQTHLCCAKHHAEASHSRLQLHNTVKVFTRLPGPLPLIRRWGSTQLLGNSVLHVIQRVVV